MKLEALKERAKQQRKQKNGKMPKDGKAVYLVHYDSKTHKEQVGINVYKEGKTGLFSCDFWMPVLIPEEKKIYIIPADATFGYKVQAKNGTSGMRSVHFTNVAMGKMIEELDINRKGFDWKFDTECRKWFISLDNKHDKKVQKTRQEELESFWND